MFGFRKRLFLYLRKKYSHNFSFLALEFKCPQSREGGDKCQLNIFFHTINITYKFNGALTGDRNTEEATEKYIHAQEKT